MVPEACVILVDHSVVLDGTLVHVSWVLHKQFHVLGVPYSLSLVLRAAYMQTLVFVALFDHKLELHVAQASMAQVLCMLVVGGKKRVLAQVCI